MSPTTAMDLTEIISALNAHVGGDKAKAKEVAKALRADAKDVAQALINVGAGQKAGEIGGRVQELEQKVSELTGELEARETELTEIRTKTPSAQELEDNARKKWEPKVAKAQQERDEALTRAKSIVKQVAREKLINRLTAPDDQGMRVDREYAELVAAAKLDDRFVVKDDGSVDVLQYGDTSPYDGDTLDQKITQLAKDFRPAVPPTFVASNADSGAGVRNGAGGRVGTKTIDQIVQEKRNNPAFAGL